MIINLHNVIRHPSPLAPVYMDGILVRTTQVDGLWLLIMMSTGFNGEEN
jgi:hypothetical protein